MNDDVLSSAVNDLLEEARHRMLRSTHLFSREALFNASLFLRYLIEGREVTHHVQVWSSRAGAMIDSRIWLVVDLLNKYNVETVFSCEDIRNDGSHTVQIVVDKASKKPMKKLLSGIREEHTKLSSGIEYLLPWESCILLLQKLLRKESGNADH